jgi:hypothetical protein
MDNLTPNKSTTVAINENSTIEKQQNDLVVVEKFINRPFHIRIFKFLTLTPSQKDLLKYQRKVTKNSIENNKPNFDPSNIFEVEKLNF